MANMNALRDSGLSAFLFSNVGTEANGSGLTILSLLARLDKDPWEEADAWSRKPRDAAIRSLRDSIAQMPPNQQALYDAEQTASRLVALLPAPGGSSGARAGASSGAAAASPLAAIPKGSLLALVGLSLFLVFNVWLAAGPKPEAAPAATPAAHVEEVPTN